MSSRIKKNTHFTQPHKVRHTHTHTYAIQCHVPSITIGTNNLDEFILIEMKREKKEKKKTSRHTHKLRKDTKVRVRKMLKIFSIRTEKKKKKYHSDFIIYCYRRFTTSILFLGNNREAKKNRQNNAKIQILNLR